MWVPARTNMNRNPRETCFKNYEVESHFQGELSKK